VDGTGSSRSADPGGWILRIGVAAFFLLAGVEKFSADPHNQWIAIFDRIGVGQWFRYATGIVEVVGAVLYVFPALCKPGAVLLVSAMVGAIVAHVTVLRDPGASAIPAALLVATVLIALRDPSPERRSEDRRSS
jgi:putative oxidoreductase